MDITTVKNILGITTNKHDTYLTTVIPLFVDAVKDYCNNPFLNDDGVEDLPGGVQIAIAKWCEYNMHKSGVNHRTMGEVNHTFNAEIPEPIKVHLKRHRRLKFA